MGLNYTAVDQTPEVTANRIAGGRCSVVEWRGALAGTIVVKPTYQTNECEYFTKPNVAAVHQFAVEPALQSRGVGRALLGECERWAAEHGFRELAMDTAEQAPHLITLCSKRGLQTCRPGVVAGQGVSQRCPEQGNAMTPTTQGLPAASGALSVLE